jgi:hypothetical protein
MRVPIVEDQVKPAGRLWRALRGGGMAADIAGKGEDALWMTAATKCAALRDRGYRLREDGRR